MPKYVTEKSVGHSSSQIPNFELLKTWKKKFLLICRPFSNVTIFREYRRIILIYKKNSNILFVFFQASRIKWKLNWSHQIKTQVWSYLLFAIRMKKRKNFWKGSSFNFTYPFDPHRIVEMNSIIILFSFSHHSWICSRFLSSPISSIAYFFLQQMT